MASVSRTTNHFFRGPWLLLIADQGTEATEEMGYTRGMNVAITHTKASDHVQELLEKAESWTVDRLSKISGTLAQINADNLGRVLGITPENQFIGLGGSAEDLEVAIRAIGKRKDGGPIHLILDRAESTGALETALMKDKNADIPFEFEGLSATTNGILMGMTVANATIATGAFARTNANPTQQITHIKMAGEGGAADALTDITGATSLVDREVIRLQIQDTTQAITITHAGGVIETKDSADFVMTKLADWIDLYYDLANTTWKELGRFDA